MKVAELRDELVKSYGYKTEEVGAIKKVELMGMLKEERSLQEIEGLNFEDGTKDFVPEEESQENSIESQKEPSAPSLSSPEWSDYVLSKFEHDEMVDGNPTVDGLRRITELVLGPIVNTETEIVQVPTKENEGRATAVCTVAVLVGDTGYSRKASGSGDAWHKNTDMPYSKFPVAMAETRAEGRALRRVLQLRKVVAAEELSARATDSQDEDYSESVNENQSNFIDVMCKSDGRGMDIDVEKFVTSQYPHIKNMDQLTHFEASSLIQMLSRYQQNMEDVPASIKQYKASWRNTFNVSNS